MNPGISEKQPLHVVMVSRPDLRNAIDLLFMTVLIGQGPNFTL
jgi:hypothetical protein